MTDLSRKTVLFADLGGDYVHVCESVVSDYGRVLYWVPWDAGFPVSRNLLPGIGLDGIERVTDIFDHLDDVDLFVFPDVGYGGMQEWLRREGHAVFGSGRAQRLERDRVFLREVCQRAGLDVAAGGMVQGLQQLRSILSKDGDWWVKLSTWTRGDAETFHHTSALASRAWLDDLSLRMGPYGSLAKFVVEEPIGDNDGPCVEIGFDSFCADGQFPKNLMFAYEIKDSCLIASTGKLSDRLQRTMDALAPVLGAFDYRGAFSTETREDASGTYFLDATCRFGSPPSELQSKMITNLGDILWGVAHGEVVEPEYASRFGVQIVLRSDWFMEHPLAVEVENWDRVAIHGHCKVDGQDYGVSVSEIPELGGACGLGDTVSAAVEEALEVAEGVKGFQVHYDQGAVREAINAIRDGEKLGIAWNSLVERSDDGRLSHSGELG